MPLHFDKDAYFAAVRDELFGGALSQVQVDGQSIILAVAEYEAGGTPAATRGGSRICLLRSTMRQVNNSGRSRNTVRDRDIPMAILIQKPALLIMDADLFN